jgi:peptidyl-prolyl cis-trans isomerase SurA
LQLQEAKRNSLVVSDEDVKQALDAMGPVGPKGEPIREFIKQRGLSQRSVENQLRAQLAWGKVVQRKLRRNISIPQDEVRRAQQSQAAAPGEQELRIGALDIAVTDSSKEADAAKLADEIGLQLKAGTDMATIAARYVRQSDVQYRPPTWVQEKALPPALQQALRAIPTGEFTPPLPSPNMLQILQVVDRKVAPKQADTTEYAIKQITIGVPKKRDKASAAKLRQVASAVRANPGSCMDDVMPKVELPVEVKFVRARLGAMSPEQRGVVSHLEVGDVSEPLLSPDAVRLLVMCEKIEPAAGNLPDAEKVRQELFTEKLELEAQKHLRNLRRDAFIDIKGAR